MTNPQKKNSETIIELWTQLKAKLEQLIFIKENKDLLIEAVEFHRNQASFITSENFLREQRNRLCLPPDWTITSLTEPTVPEHNPDGTINPEWRQYFAQHEWNACLSQQAKNQQIVRASQQLLAQLTKL